MNMRFAALLAGLLLLPWLMTGRTSDAKSRVGMKAPEFVVEKWLSAEPDRNGRFTLIDFWAPWCPDCRELIPELNALHRKFGDKLVVVGVTEEPEAKVRALKKPRIEYASAIDTQARMKKTLAPPGIPYVIIVDPAGVVRWEGLPGTDGHELNAKVVGRLLAAGRE